MKLIFVRHAEATERSSDLSDHLRYLTPEGRRFFRKTARTMLKKGVEPSLILSSPLVRAVQTTEILAETLSYVGPLHVRKELEPGFSKDELKSLLDEYQNVAELVIVGHEPDLSELISSLLTLPEGFDLKKGAAVKLKIDSRNLQQTGSFKWLAVGKKLLGECEENGA